MPPVHVDARDELRKQPEADQHDAGLNQHRAQEQQRPMLEEHRRARDELRPHYPGAGGRAGRDAGEADRTEEVQRTRHVAQQEADGDEIRGDAPGTREAIVRLVLRTRDVRDGHFGDPRAAPARQGWNEPVQIAVEPDPFDHRRAIRLERRPEIVQRHARQLRHQPVRDSRRQAARPQVVDALLPPAADDVVPFAQFREEPGNLFRRVLQVAVHRHDHVAGGPVEARRESRGLTVVPRERREPHARVAPGNRRQRFGGAVAAAVVHIHDFRRQTDQEEHLRQAFVQLVDRRHLVEERHHDRQLRRAVRITRHDESSF